MKEMKPPIKHAPRKIEGFDSFELHKKRCFPMRKVKWYKKIHTAFQSGEI